MTDINEIRQGLEGTTAQPLRYEIQYGPDGEDKYAWVYRGRKMLAAMQTHDASAIVTAVNSIRLLLSRLEEAERQRDEARAATIAAHRNFIDAWESLPGGQNYDAGTFQRWINGEMKSAVDRARTLAKEQTNG